MRRLVASLLLLAAPAFAQGVADAIRDTLGGDPAEYRRVIEGFQTALRARNAAAAATFVNYPITVTMDGRSRTIAGPAEFAAHYSRIVTPAIAAAVENQPFDDLFVRDQGVMLGDGEVWVSGVCRDAACERQDVRVITIQPGG